MRPPLALNSRLPFASRFLLATAVNLIKRKKEESEEDEMRFSLRFVPLSSTWKFPSDFKYSNNCGSRDGNTAFKTP